jgi:hypothetical protein
MRRSRAITLVCGASAFWPRIAQAADDVQKLAEQTIRRLDLQTDFPDVSEPLQAPFRLQLPSEVLWVIIIVAIGSMLYAFRDMIPGFGLGHGSAWNNDDTSTGESRLRTAEATLEEADVLAARGNFVDAMHALLLQGLANMRERLNEQFADSFTSREILRSTKLPQEGRNSLHDIVTRVEWTYFGERPATKTDYEACRASFAALTNSLHRGKAA